MQLPADWSGSYQVKLSFTSADEVTAARNKDHAAADLEAFVIDTIAYPVEEDDDEADQAGPPAPVNDDDAASEFCCSNIDLTELQRKIATGVYEMRCQFSINGQDFSALKVKADNNNNSAPPSPSTLLYLFSPESVYPRSFPLTGGGASDSSSSSSQVADTEVTITGSGFLTTSRLLRGAKTVVSLEPILSDIAWTPAASAVSAVAMSGLTLTNSIVAPIRCDYSNKISITMNKAIFKQLQEMSVVLNRAISRQLNNKEQQDDDDGGTQYINILPIRFGFELNISKQTVPLCDHSNDNDNESSMRMNMYTDQPLLLIPNCSNLRSSSTTTTQLSVFVNRSSCADGFDFMSQDVVMAVHIPILRSENTADDNDDAPRFYPPTIINSPAVVVTALSGDSSVSSSPAAKYLLQAEIQSFRYYLNHAIGHPESTDGGDPEDFGSYQYFYVSVWLDGKSMPSSDCWGKIYLYRDLAQEYTLLPAVPPKTGFTAGTTITLQLASHCPTAPPISPSLMAILSDEVKASIVAQQCVVRVRGSEEDAAAGVSIPGRLIEEEVSPDNTSSSSPMSIIDFVIPEGVRSSPGMTAVQKTPKDKPVYYVDVSMDGGSIFDRASLPLLNLK